MTKVSVLHQITIEHSDSVQETCGRTEYQPKVVLFLTGACVQQSPVAQPHSRQDLADMHLRCCFLEAVL